LATPQPGIPPPQDWGFGVDGGSGLGAVRGVDPPAPPWATCCL